MNGIGPLETPAMTDDQELRQHWQQLAEQLGLEPSAQSTREEKEPAPPTSRPTRIEERESPDQNRESKIEDRPSLVGPPETKDQEPILESPSDSVESGWRLQVPEGPPAEYSPAEPPEEERRGSRRGRGGRRSDRGERSSRPRRGGRSWIREEEPTPAEEPARPFAEEETREVVESSDEADLAILHDSSSPEPEKEEEEDSDDVDTLSDWNVPSWTELIGSQYRPER